MAGIIGPVARSSGEGTLGQALYCGLSIDDWYNEA
jgi:hypothetical protein